MLEHNKGVVDYPDGLTREMISAEIEDAVERGIQKALRQIGLVLGVDVSSPDGVLEAQRDWMHLRGWRRSTETIKSKGLGAVVMFLTASALGAFLYAVRGFMATGQPPPH
jgi:hypothetical protein